MYKKQLAVGNKIGYSEDMKNDRLIDIRTITEDGPAVHFRATEAERQEIANRFELLSLKELVVDGSFSVEDTIVFSGKMHTEANRVCSVTLNPFVEKTDIPVQIAFSENESDDNTPLDIDVFPIVKGKIDLFDTFSEVFGLSLNPFPKSVSKYFDYHDPTDTEKANPFAALAKLKKKG